TICKNHSDPEMALSFTSRTIDADENSISGFVALTGKPVNIGNVNTWKGPPHYNRAFAEERKYPLISMLTIPIKHMGMVIAVLQLINPKPEYSAKLENTWASRRTICTYSESDSAMLEVLAQGAARKFHQLSFDSK
ncbi:GAF domain-containing protein, partial [Candidatus Micrarchaeota archaeon]|nr:GAF domain-containing protein [Candidatus Micrarchaeota archaeon]